MLMQMVRQTLMLEITTRRRKRLPVVPLPRRREKNRTRKLSTIATSRIRKIKFSTGLLKSSPKRS